jgi:hypothetical protein
VPSIGAQFFLNNLVRKLIMKKIALSLAIFSLSVGAFSVASAAGDNRPEKPITTVTIDNVYNNLDVIAEALDKNCEVIVSKKVCAHEVSKLVVKCTKDFKFAACPANFGTADYPYPPKQTCDNNPGTRFCGIDSPTFVKITSDRRGNLILECKKRRD